MSAIVNFYSGTGRDGSGRTLDEILRWPDHQLEAVHDYIQWLFPLPEPSGANPWAPVLTPQDIAAFHASEPMRTRLHEAFTRMLRFYGLVEENAIERRPAFAVHARNWLTPGNHNHLRITRILRCLRVLGLEAEAQAFWEFLRCLYDDESAAGRNTITGRTFAFWERAATAPLESWLAE